MSLQKKNKANPPLLVGALTLIIALILPLFLGSYWLHVIIIAFYFAILASSWSLLCGYAGQFSFGHMAFMAIGAYTTGIMGRFYGTHPIPGIIMGTIIAGLVGLLIGLLVLRLKAAYLALFTLAFSEILRTLIRGEPLITRGDHGLRVARFFGDTISRIPYYYTMLALLILCLLVMYLICTSKIGLFLRAIREDETAASARGVDVVKYKLLVFVITAMIAGVAGAFNAHYVEIITPSIMIIPQMGLVIAMTIIGGVENIFAAAIGAIVIQVFLEVARRFEAWRLVIFGAAMVITLRFARDGLVTPLFQRLFDLKPKAEMRQEVAPK